MQISYQVMNTLTEALLHLSIFTTFLKNYSRGTVLLSPINLAAYCHQTNKK